MGLVALLALLQDDPPACVILLDDSEASTAMLRAFEDPSLSRLTKKFAVKKILADAAAVRRFGARAPAILVDAPRERVDVVVSEKDREIAKYINDTLNDSRLDLKAAVETLRNQWGTNVVLDPLLKAEDDSREALFQAGLIVIGKKDSIVPLRGLEHVAGSRVNAEKLAHMKIDLAYENEPLEIVLLYLHEYSGFTFQIDPDHAARPVTFSAKNVSVATVLELVLRRFHLAARVEEKNIVIYPAAPPCRDASSRAIAEYLGRFVEFEDAELSASERESIERAISDLGDDALDVRNQAGRRLREMLPQAKRKMRRELEKTKDPEVQWRLRELLAP